MENETAFTALILAGDREPNDPVADAAGVTCKAFTPIGNKMMVMRVLDALQTSKDIDERILCGPPWPIVKTNKELSQRIAKKQFKWVKCGTTPSISTQMGLTEVAENIPVLLTTADHALLSSEIVNYFCKHARHGNFDVLIGLARAESITATYPEVKRTILKFADGGYSGCNLYAFMTPKGRTIVHFWRNLENQRKKPWRLIHAAGWLSVLRYLLGRLPLNTAIENLGKRLNLCIGIVILPFPEAAIDVDKVSDLTFVKRVVSEKQESPR